MPTVTLVLQGEKLVGASDRDDRAYQRFIARIKALADSCITFSWREPRSGPFHRWFFAQMNRVLEAQDRFEDMEAFMCWAKTGAGYCEFLPHPKHGLIAVPKSIAFDKLDQIEFDPIARAILGFLRSDHARETLWPHLGAARAMEMVDVLLEGFR